VFSDACKKGDMREKTKGDYPKQLSVTFGRSGCGHWRGIGRGA